MRALIMFLVTVCGLALVTTPAEALDRTKECRYASLQGDKTMNVKEAKLTIRCAVNKMPVAGGVSRALQVASCESGFYEKAYNSSSSAGGIYQVIAGTWHSWTYHFRNWRHQHKIGTNRFEGRPNIMVSIRAASQWGWGAWSC